MVTYERNVGENEVSLNGTTFKLLGPVRTTLASAYPEKQITGGDYSADSHPWASIHDWNDFSEGFGVDRMVIGKHDRRSFFSTADGSTPFHLVKRALAVQTESDHVVGDPLINELGGAIVTAFGTGVEDYSGSAWTNRHTLAATPTDVLNFSIGTTEYLIYCYTSGYAYSSAIATWNTSTKNAVKLAYWDNRLWGIDATGQLWYTFTPGSNERNNAQLVLSQNDVITGLFPSRLPNDQVVLYCTTERYLYVHEFDHCRWTRLGLAIAPEGLSATNHERKATNWQDQMYLLSSSGVIKHGEDASVQEIGPDLDDGLPIGEYEQTLFCMAESVKDLLVAGSPLSSTDRALIMGYNGRGWRTIWEAEADNIRIESMHVSHIGAYRCWFGYNDRVWYIRLNQTNANPKQITGWTYASQNDVHKTPWFAPSEDALLTAIELRVRTRDCTSNETILYEYALDYDDSSYTTLGTVSSNGQTVFTFPDNGSTKNVGANFQAIRIRRTLARGGTTTLSPDGVSISLKYRKKLPSRWLHRMQIDMRDDFGVSPAEQWTLLRAALETQGLIEMTFRDDTGNTENHYVDVVKPQADEETGLDEAPGIVTVTTVEMLSGA